MAPGHLVTRADFALLGDTDTHQLVDAWRQFIPLVARENLHFNNFATLTMRHAQGGILDLAGLFTENGSQQLFLSSQLGLALGSYLADENVLRPNLGANIDDATLVEVTQSLLTDIWNVARDFFWSKLGVACVDLVLFNMDRGEEVFTHYALTDKNGIFEVATLPAHKGDEYILSKRKFSIVCR